MADEVTPPQSAETAQLRQPAPPPPQPPTPAGNRWARWRRALRVVGWGALAVVLVAVVLAAVRIATNDRTGGASFRAKQGDCFSGESDSDLKRVQCDDPAVRWMVLGVVEHKTKQEAKQRACEAWPNAEASYWESRNGTDGFVLCLGSVTAG